MPRFRVSPVSRIPGSWLRFACARACVRVSFYRVTRSRAYAREHVVCSRTEICTSGYGHTFSPSSFRFLPILRAGIILLSILSTPRKARQFIKLLWMKNTRSDISFKFYT